MVTWESFKFPTVAIESWNYRASVYMESCVKHQCLSVGDVSSCFCFENALSLLIYLLWCAPICLFSMGYCIIMFQLQYDFQNRVIKFFLASYLYWNYGASWNSLCLHFLTCKFPPLLPLDFKNKKWWGVLDGCRIIRQENIKIILWIRIK